MSLFVAWMPEEDAQAGLLGLQDEVDAQLATPQRFRWRPKDKLHMTLRYLGHVVDDLAPGFAQSLADIAAQHRRITMRFDRVEVWPGAKALVARIAASDALDALLDRIDAAAIAAGYAAHSGHQTAHVTLAYADGQSVAASTIPLANVFHTVLGHLSIVQTTSGGYDQRDWWALQDRAVADPNERS